MYGLLVAFDPTRETLVSRGRNEGLNFVNVAVESEIAGDRDHGSGSGIVRNIECWLCGGEHMKRDCQKCTKEKKKEKKDDGGVDDKHTEVTGGHLHTMFRSSVDVLSGTDFSELEEDDKLTRHQFHVKGWGAQYFEGNAPMAMHNATGKAVPLTWIPLDSQLTVDLIANPKIMLNISKVQGEDAIRVYCNSGVKIVDRDGDLPGYGNVWYKPTGITNILSMSRTTKKFWVVFVSEGGNLSGWSYQTGE